MSYRMGIESLQQTTDILEARESLDRLFTLHNIGTPLEEVIQSGNEAVTKQAIAQQRIQLELRRSPDLNEVTNTLLLQETVDQFNMLYATLNHFNIPTELIFDELVVNSLIETIKSDSWNQYLSTHGLISVQEAGSDKMIVENIAHQNKQVSPQNDTKTPRKIVQKCSKENFRNTCITNLKKTIKNLGYRNCSVTMNQIKLNNSSAKYDGGFYFKYKLPAVYDPRDLASILIPAREVVLELDITKMPFQSVYHHIYTKFFNQTENLDLSTFPRLANYIEDKERFVRLVKISESRTKAVEEFKKLLQLFPKSGKELFLDSDSLNDSHSPLSKFIEKNFPVLFTHFTTMSVPGILKIKIVEGDGEILVGDIREDARIELNFEPLIEPIEVNIDPLDKEKIISMSDVAKIGEIGNLLSDLQFVYSVTKEGSVLSDASKKEAILKRVIYEYVMVMKPIMFPVEHYSYYIDHPFYKIYCFLRNSKDIDCVTHLDLLNFEKTLVVKSDNENDLIVKSDNYANFVQQIDYIYLKVTGSDNKEFLRNNIYPLIKYILAGHGDGVQHLIDQNLPTESKKLILLIVNPIIELFSKFSWYIKNPNKYINEPYPESATTIIA